MIPLWGFIYTTRIYPESEIQSLLTTNYRKPIIDGTVK
jgi:hypothetical protein